MGLTCAVRLAEAGHDTLIWARELPPNTTSDVAAAIWYPHKGEPLEAFRRWAVETLLELQKLADTPEVTGVRLVSGFKYFHRRMGPPWWASHVKDFRLMNQSQVPDGCRAGYGFSLPVADMTRYSAYLEKRFFSAGGKREQRAIGSLKETEGVAELVVNCTGLGSRELVGDNALFAIRGQVLRVPKLSRDEVILDDDHPDGMIYVIPRFNETILGGVSEVGNESLAPDERTSVLIRQRCAHYFPELLQSNEAIVKVGLRPGRNSVRLEREGSVIHCYGHGGSGVSLSWGCARSVLEFSAGGLAS